MHARERLGTKIAIGCMAAATALTAAIPRALGADEKPKASAVEVENKVPKKSKRKRSSAPKHHGWHTASIAARGWTRPAAPIKRLSPIDIVLAAARKQLGKPYHYGSVGPSSFDCSGFTRFVYAAAGVHLPHNSSAQYASTKHVSLDKLKPGDLVFSPGHVGLYIGHGQMIHAPETGDHVRVAPLHGSVYGAGRPLAR